MTSTLLPWSGSRTSFGSTSIVRCTRRGLHQNYLWERLGSLIGPSFSFLTLLLEATSPAILTLLQFFHDQCRSITFASTNEQVHRVRLVTFTAQSQTTPQFSTPCPAPCLCFQLWLCTFLLLAPSAL